MHFFPNAKIAQIAQNAKLAKSLIHVSGYKRIMNEMIDNHKVTETRRTPGEKTIYPQIAPTPPSCGRDVAQIYADGEGNGCAFGEKSKRNLFFFRVSRTLTLP
jgi:hypothetical protein